MANSERRDIDNYLEEANGWEKSHRRLIDNSEIKAWRVAYASLAIAGAAVLAVLALTPLKTVKTEVLVLDKSAGTIEPLQSLGVVQVTLDEVFHKHFLTMFMLARENYTAETAETNYYTAAAFLSPQLQEEWGKLWKPETPENPINIYKSSKARINIASIILKPKDDGSQNVATIRFSKSIEGPSIKDAGKFWVATITYRLVEAPKDEKERRINPIGFQVINYTVDPEIAGAQIIKPFSVK